MLNIEETLGIEIKKEIADRYFGFRKLIEEDTTNYLQHIEETYQQLEQEVGLDLLRIYFLLHTQEHIILFFQITHIQDELFFEPYLLEQSTLRHQLFAKQRYHGFTKKQRFRHLFVNLYHSLTHGLAQYQVHRRKLAQEHKAIKEEIQLFYRNNDLDCMMGFLRSLGHDGRQEFLASGERGPWSDGYFAQKMHLSPPAGVDTYLPKYSAPPTLKNCKNELLSLVDQAFLLQGRPDVRQCFF